MQLHGQCTLLLPSTHPTGWQHQERCGTALQPGACVPEVCVGDQLTVRPSHQEIASFILQGSQNTKTQQRSKVCQAAATCNRLHNLHTLGAAVCHGITRQDC